MAFFEYSQNNSGGSFDFDHWDGISVHVIVEADTAEEANEKAESIGLYFDGYGDCSCCGNRWSEAGGWFGEEKGDEFPSIFGTPVWDRKDNSFGINWEEPGTPFAYVHFADGTFAGVVKGSNGNYAVRGVREEGAWTFVPVALTQMEEPKELDHGTIVLEIEA